MSVSPRRPRILVRPTWTETQFVAAALRTETVGGALLLLAALVALVWENTPAFHGYEALRDWSIGPPQLHLSLTSAQWASDGLLALFFFVAGLELKRELVVGELRTLAKAAVPVTAALSGVVVPAVMYAATVAVRGGGAAALRGWAIPTATDIAFALAVLAVIGTHLPSALRSFLLTLAVVDDLVAITIIAIFYTSSLHPMLLLVALVPIVMFGWLTQRRVTRWWLLVPLAVLAWGLVHASGVHATVAGIVLGLIVPVRPRSEVASQDASQDATTTKGTTGTTDTLGADELTEDLAHLFEHRLRPLSAGVAVPVFAFFAAGVRVVGGGFGQSLSDTAALGIALGLVVGKFVGVLGGTWAVARFTHAELDDDLAWWDVAGLSLLAGMGFTVSLLVAELAFGPGTPHDQHAKVAVLVASSLAAVLAAIVLRARNTAYGRLETLEPHG